MSMASSAQYPNIAYIKPTKRQKLQEEKTCGCWFAWLLPGKPTSTYDSEEEGVSLKVERLVQDDAGIPVGIIHQPGRLVGWHVDAAVGTVSGTAVASGINMGELCTWTIIGTPPGVM